MPYKKNIKIESVIKMKKLSTYQKRTLLIIGIVILLFLIINVRFPYYLYKPGNTDNIHEIITVEGQSVSQGDYHLVTVSGRQASLIDIISAQILPYHEIEKLEDIHPDNMSDDEYWNYQLQMMKTSQNAATIVAYEHANEKIDVEHQGVFVGQIVASMPAEDVLQVGDVITAVDGKNVAQPVDLMSYVDGLKAEDSIELTFDRDGKSHNETVELSNFPDDPEKVGLGIVLMAEDQVSVSRSIDFESGDIGGPSAGLMFTLEIYDQLLEADISKGYHIAGTGEIDEDGNVHRIGGIDKKVVAADEAGMDIFFAPNEADAAHSNYAIAKTTAKKIKSEMKIVPVDHFSDAIDYLENIQKK